MTIQNFHYSKHPIFQSFEFEPSNQYVSFHVHCTTSWECHPFNRVFINAKVLFSTINQMFLLMPFLQNMVILRGLFRYLTMPELGRIWCKTNNIRRLYWLGKSSLLNMSTSKWTLFLFDENRKYYQNALSLASTFCELNKILP